MKISNNIQMKNNLKAIVFLLLVVTSCKKEAIVPDGLPIIKEQKSGYPAITRQVPYNKIEIPTDPQKLVFDTKGKDVSLSAVQDTVVVFIEGGPTHIADAATLQQVKEVINDNGFPKYSVIGLRQSHNLNPTVFGSGASFTEANAQEVNSQTLDIAEKVISWLSSNKKVVYLFGHSNGSFIVQNYMTTGKTNPKGYIISGTRLKQVQAFFENYPKNIDISFKDGITVVKTTITGNQLPYFNVLTKLQLNHIKDYKTLLKNNAMLSRTVYSLGGKDEALGILEQDENDFLKNNKVPNLTIPEWGHGDAAIGVVAALGYLRKNK